MIDQDHLVNYLLARLLHAMFTNNGHNSMRLLFIITAKNGTKGDILKYFKIPNLLTNFN